MAEASVTNVSKFASEFVGTFLLVLTVALVSSQAMKDPSCPAGFAGPFAVGTVLTVMVYSLGRISGGYFNPAVTFAAAYQHVINYDTAFMYTLIQFGAGLAAAWVNRFLWGFATEYDPKVSPPDPDLNFGEFSMIQCAMIEMFYTFMLTFVVLNVCIHTPKDDKSAVEREYAGLCIGFVILAGGYGAGRVSGGFFNPAAAVGLDVAHLIHAKSFSFLYSLPYVGAQYAGAFLSVTALHLVRKDSRPSNEGLPWYHPLKVALKIESYCLPELSAEFLGTFFVTFTFGCNVMANDWAAKHEKAVPFSPVAISVGAALMVMIYAVGDVSHGGHFNPAVTISIFLSGRCKEFFPLLRVAEYVVTQLLAGGLAATASWLVFWNPGFDEATSHISVVDTLPPKGFDGGIQAFIAEFAMTFLLCYVVLTVASGPAALKSYYGFAVGAAIISGGTAFGCFTKGFINPAITLGSAFISFLFWKNFNWVLLLLGELLGAAAAAMFTKYITHPSEYDASHAAFAGEPLLNKAEA